MKSDNFPLALVAATVVGIAQVLLLLYCWNFIAAYSPLPRWLISLGVTGMSLRALAFALDSIVSVALCLPAAFLLCQLRPRKLLIYLIAAVVPGFIWQYLFVFQGPASLPEVGLFIPGILSALFVLPAATFFATRMSRSAHA